MYRVMRFIFGLLFCCFVSIAEAAVLPADAELQLIDMEEAAVCATECLEQTIANGEDTRRHSLELINKPRDFKAPVGAVSFEPLIPYGVRYGSSTAVEVMVKIDGKAYRKVRCSYRVHVFDNVVVAIKNLQPRRLIEAADVQTEERDVSGINRKYISELDKVVGHEANRIIKAGSIFTKGMIVNPVIIESGSQIYVIAVVNGVTVKSEAVALERGRKDAVIRVKNVDSGRILQGKVIDENTVQVL